MVQKEYHTVSLIKNSVSRDPALVSGIYITVSPTALVHGASGRLFHLAVPEPEPNPLKLKLGQETNGRLKGIEHGCLRKRTKITNFYGRGCRGMMTNLGQE